ncbi:MAG: GNAT family N-acetyltransferase [Roseiflexaceae bacterium]|nr:GNAT family N-acetyltransferase [Roseiflexaceae bacterium]
MNIIQEASSDAIEALIPILLQAEESERALRWGLANLVDSVYQMDIDGKPAAAATVQWRNDPAEIIELAVAPNLHGQGYGRRMLQSIIDLARQRGKQRLIVGTANSSIGNIAFYQKCGFRMESVRRDYFWYYREPVYEHGIRIRDMLVFSYDLREDQAS